ncbi:MAG TPA: FKBP-type peptidyl-prolyl cis-trans isomerase [Opitutaceae bacterium]|nr:FKBP-type peptidyl-prolyl cis-trans isomerase [Opitutaceae bacterium]
MKKNLIIVAAVLVAACAAAQDPKPAAVARKTAEDAQPACQASPKELVVKDLKVGEGRDVIPRSSVLVQYTGWLYDGCKPDLKGAKFDSSLDRPVPFGFVVGAGRVIKGWDEGVVGMKEKGHKRLLVIPPDKGYGERGAGDRIPPNASLVFEIETVQIAFYPNQQPAGEPKK